MPILTSDPWRGPFAEDTHRVVRQLTTGCGAGERTGISIGQGAKADSTRLWRRAPRRHGRQTRRASPLQAGVNPLNFHLAFHLGRRLAEVPGGFFHVISKDTGFDSLIRHSKARKVFSAPSASKEEMPCFSAATPAPPQGQPAVSPPPALPNEARSFDKRWKLALAHLVSTRATKPAKTRTLHSTIHPKLGNHPPASTMDRYGVLRAGQAGNVRVTGRARPYVLPAE